MLVSTAILTSLNFMYGPIELSNGKKRIKREREKGGGVEGDGRRGRVFGRVRGGIGRGGRKTLGIGTVGASIKRPVHQ